MILPPTIFLKGVRILGSILFVAGSFTFAVCALQVYLGKLFRWGIASKRLVQQDSASSIPCPGAMGNRDEHSLAKILVLASLSLMFILYYFLAEEEERRMLGKFGEGYREYMNHTGMFLPRLLEARLSAPFEYLREQRSQTDNDHFLHSHRDHWNRIYSQGGYTEFTSHPKQAGI